MPQTIPHKLHFIWMGNPLPRPYACNFLRWANQNTAYTVHLWAEHAVFDSIVELLQEVFPTMQDLHPEAKIVQLMQPEGVTIQFFRKHMTPISINVFYIETLVAQSNVMLLHEERHQWKRYGGASDILRLWVLYNHGGIYFDFDIFPVEKHIPLQIPAPKGILFCEDIDRYGIMVSIVASPKESFAVKSLLDSIDLEQITTPVLTPGIVEVTPAAQDLYQKIELYREKLRRLASWENWRKEGIKHTLEILLRTTSARTGTCKVYDWITKIEGTDVDTRFSVSVNASDTMEALRLDERTEEDSDYEDGDLMCLYNDAVALLYSFQRQADYYPIIEIHGSWIE